MIREIKTDLSVYDYQDNNLVIYHYHDLLILLKEARKETSEAYNLLTSIRKLGDIADPEVINETQKQYIEWKNRKTGIEAIIESRLGYCPARITDKMIDEIKKQDSDWHKRMAKTKSPQKNV